MAEHVQATLDRMVSDLVLFQKDSPFSTLLSPAELQSMVEKRRSNEYLLRRRNPRCADFLNYIQYETQLYQLLQLRFTKHLKVDKALSSSSPGKSSQKAIRKEYQQMVVRPILQHIHLLYIRTLRRYKHQYALFQQYADFCRQVSSHQRLHACYQDALKYHAHNLQLWYDLVQYEFRNLFSEDRVRTTSTISSLRTILQRGIRLHPTSIHLWMYSLQVELQYIKTRSSLTQDNDEATNASSIREDENAVQKYYSLIVVIYDHALQSLKKDDQRMMHFHTQCVDLLYEYWDPPHTDAIVQHIFDTVTNLGSDRSSASEQPPSPLRYMLRATLALAIRRKQLSAAAAMPDSQDEEDDDVLNILQEACQAIPTSEMMVMALQFLRHNYLRPLLSQGDASNVDRIRSMIDDLYRNFRENETKSESAGGVAPVLYEYIQYLIQDGTDDNGINPVRRALYLLKDFVAQNTTPGAVSSSLWIQYAALTYCDSSVSSAGDVSRCIAILQQALQHIPMHQQPDYSNVLEQLFCTYTHCRTTVKAELDEAVSVSDTMILKLLDEIVLLSPGRSPLLPPSGTQQVLLMESSPTDSSQNREIGGRSPISGIVSTIPNLPSACYQYVKILIAQLRQLSLDSPDSHAVKLTEQLFRKVCDKALLDSNLLFYWLTCSSSDVGTNPMEGMGERSTVVVVQQLFDMVIEAEVDYLRVIRLYDRAIGLFRFYVPSWVQIYQERKAEIIRYHSSDQVGTRGTTVANKRRKLIAMSRDSPVLNDHDALLASIPVIDFIDAAACADKVMQLYSKCQVLHVKNEIARSSASTISPTKFCWKDIGPLFDQLNEEDQATFCIEKAADVSKEMPQAETFLSSCIANAKDRAYCSFLLQKSKELYSATIQKLPFQEFPHIGWVYEPTVWFFFGRNLIGSTNLDGRPEHTDSVSHDGTWHYQLSGSKRWFIRPTSELLNQLQLPNLSTSLEWCVDCQEGDILIINTRLWLHRTMIPPQRMPSVSYARDFRFGDALVHGTSCTMTNVDGLYATEDISKGTIIFTETGMPDCELHRSSIDPNCEVVSLEDGTSAVMSIRLIKAGEFFCVPESSDEESFETNESDSASLHSIE
jgi:U3 small nucleolar RNA-associated protein 6